MYKNRKKQKYLKNEKDQTKKKQNREKRPK